MNTKEKEMIQAVRDDVGCFIFNEKAEDAIPLSLIRIYKVSVIMSLLFEPYKLGEMFNNVVYQIARILNNFEYKLQPFNENDKQIYLDYLKQLGDQQMKALQEIQKQLEKKQD